MPFLFFFLSFFPSSLPSALLAFSCSPSYRLFHHGECPSLYSGLQPSQLAEPRQANESPPPPWASPDVIITSVCPGIIWTRLTNRLESNSLVIRLFMPVYYYLLATSADHGTRIYLEAALAGAEDHVSRDEPDGQTDEKKVLCSLGGGGGAGPSPYGIGADAVFNTKRASTCATTEPQKTTSGELLPPTLSLLTAAPRFPPLCSRAHQPELTLRVCIFQRVRPGDLERHGPEPAVAGLEGDQGDLVRQRARRTQDPARISVKK